MSLTASLRRTLDVKATSAEASPYASMIAYGDGSHVFLDDGKRRFLRGTSRKLAKCENSYVRAVTESGEVLYSSVGLVNVVSADGRVRALLPAELSHPKRHPDVHVNGADDSVTVLSGTHILQFDMETWQQRLHVDLSEELSYSAYVQCRADGDWIVLSTGGRVVLLTADGELEREFSSDRREAFMLAANRLVGVTGHPSKQETVVSSLPGDDQRETWRGHYTAWCGLVREIRGMNGQDVLVRTPTSASAQQIELPPAPPTKYAPIQSHHFAAAANVVLRYRHNQVIEVLQW